MLSSPPATAGSASSSIATAETKRSTRCLTDMEFSTMGLPSIRSRPTVRLADDSLDLYNSVRGFQVVAHECRSMGSQSLLDDEQRRSDLLPEGPAGTRGSAGH